MAESTAASISLQWILGASTSAGVKSIDSDTLLYLSGNVGVIYGISKKEQKLLRGHVSERGAICSVIHSLITRPLQRNPVRACAMSPDHSLLATACAGPESALIMWTPQGDPIALIAAPHPSGCAAVDISPDGQFLATLSVPFSVSDQTGGVRMDADTDQAVQSADTVQEVAVWSLAGTRTPVEEEDGGASAQPQCLARCVVPTASTQLSIAFRAALGAGELESIRGGASCSFELATTGPSAVVFWSLVRSRLLTRPGIDDDPAAEVSGLARAAADGLGSTVQLAPAAAGGGGAQAAAPATPAAAAAGSGGVWVDMWSLRGHACHPPGISPPTGSRGSSTQRPQSTPAATQRGATAGGPLAAAAASRHCSVSVFLPPVSTGAAVVTCATALSDGQVRKGRGGERGGGWGGRALPL